MFNLIAGTVTDGTVIFTLPAAYAAAGSNQYMAASCFPSAWNAARADGISPQIRCDSNGNFAAYGLPGHGAGNAYLTLNSNYRVA
jgi:hypothetical protein